VHRSPPVVTDVHDEERARPARQVAAWVEELVEDHGRAEPLAEPLDGPLPAIARLVLGLPVEVPDPSVPAVDLPEAVPDEQQVLAGDVLDQDVMATDGAEEARQWRAVPPCGAEAKSRAAGVDACTLGHASTVAIA